MVLGSMEISIILCVQSNTGSHSVTNNGVKDFVQDATLDQDKKHTQEIGSSHEPLRVTVTQNIVDVLL